MAVYELVIVDRQPAQLTAPTFAEVEALAGVGAFSWSRRMGRPAQASIGFPMSKQAASVKQRLNALDQFPIEVWIRRRLASQSNYTVVFAGAVTALQVQGQTGVLNVADLCSYLWRWFVEPNDVLTYSAVDQHAIGKGLVDYWQALDYGHFGIDTSGVTNSGVTRDRTYDGAEPHVIGPRLAELAEVTNGFEWTIDPHTRGLVLAHPAMGTDKSNSVIVDKRSVLNPAATWSVGPQDFASVVYGWGKDGLRSQSENATPLSTWGRVGAALSASGVSEQATLDGKTQAVRDDMSDPLYVPTPEVRTTTGDISVDAVSLGDTVSIDYDYGIGMTSAQRRVLGYLVNVGADRDERMSLELS